MAEVILVAAFLLILIGGWTLRNRAQLVGHRAAAVTLLAAIVLLMLAWSGGGEPRGPAIILTFIAIVVTLQALRLLREE